MIYSPFNISHECRTFFPSFQPGGDEGAAVGVSVWPRPCQALGLLVGNALPLLP